MHDLAERFYNRLTRYLPPGIAARIDLERPSFYECWGGPLNGQEVRRAIVREIARTVPVTRLIETGTYRGVTTQFFAAVFGVPIATIEANPRHYEFSRRRLSSDDATSVILSDSRRALRELSRTAPTDEVAFVYLDAHWHEDLPLSEELSIVATGWTQAVVLIDDFEVPGDPGYGYDDYGHGKSLTEELLPASDLQGWTIQYPAAPSGQESGARRGCCLLVSPALNQEASRLSLMTPPKAIGG